MRVIFFIPGVIFSFFLNNQCICIGRYFFFPQVELLNMFLPFFILPFHSRNMYISNGRAVYENSDFFAKLKMQLEEKIRYNV